MTTSFPYMALARGDEELSGGIIPKQKLLQEFGIGSAMPFSVPYSGPDSKNNKQLYESLRPIGPDEGPSVAQLETMRRTDGQARALFRLITEPIRSALSRATVKAEDGDTGEAEFIENMLFQPVTSGGMTIPFKRVISQMLLGVFDGFSAFELVYWIPKTGVLKGKITLQKIAYRPAATCTFLTDDHGSLAGIRQRTFFQGRTIDCKIDKNNLIYYASCEEERPFYGVSYFQSAFYHHDKKVKLYYIAHLAAQRAATGLRIGRMPKNAGVQDKATFIRAMADMGVAQYITLPGSQADGWDVEVIKDGPSFDYLAMINHQNSQMSKSLLAGWFDQAQGSGPGEQSGLIQTGGEGPKADMFEAMIRAIMDELADVLNTTLIPRFIDWNFNSVKYPQFVWGNFTDEQSASIRASFNALASLAPASQGVTPEFMRAMEEYEANEMGLDVDYDSVKKREATAKTASDKAAEVAAKQQSVMFDAQFPGGSQPNQSSDGSGPDGSPQDYGYGRDDGSGPSSDSGAEGDAAANSAPNQGPASAATGDTADEQDTSQAEQSANSGFSLDDPRELLELAQQLLDDEIDALLANTVRR